MAAAGEILVGGTPSDREEKNSNIKKKKKKNALKSFFGKARWPSELFLFRTSVRAHMPTVYTRAHTLA